MSNLFHFQSECWKITTGKLFWFKSKCYVISNFWKKLDKKCPPVSYLIYGIIFYFPYGECHYINDVWGLTTLRNVLPVLACSKDSQTQWRNYSNELRSDPFFYVTRSDNLSGREREYRFSLIKLFFCFLSNYISRLERRFDLAIAMVVLFLLWPRCEESRDNYGT